MPYKNKEDLLKHNKEYYHKNRQKILNQKREYRKKNILRFKEKDRIWHLLNKEKRNKHSREYYQKNKDKLNKRHREYFKEYYKKNREKLNEDKRNKYKNNYKNNRDNKIKYLKGYRKERKNKRRITNFRRAWKKERYWKDKNFNILEKLKRRFGEALETYTKTGKIKPSKKYGIDYKLVIEYLKPFPKDFLASRGKYNIHHIKPLYTFNFINKDGSTNLEEIKKAFAPENHKIVTIKEHKKIHKKRI